MLDLAARVHDPVAHATYRGGLVGMAVGAAVGAAVVLAVGVFAGPEVAGAGVLVFLGNAVRTGVMALGSSSAGGGFLLSWLGIGGTTAQAVHGGMTAGWLVTQTSQFARGIGSWMEGPMRVEGEIARGADTVFLSPGILPAAFADETCLVTCHSAAFVAEGSDSISIENAAASRRGDKTSCSGVITGGDATVFFGGEPTSIAGEISITTPRAYRILSTGLDYTTTVLGAPVERPWWDFFLLWLPSKAAGTVARNSDGRLAQWTGAYSGAIDTLRGGSSVRRGLQPARPGQEVSRAARLGVSGAKTEVGARNFFSFWPF